MRYSDWGWLDWQDHEYMSVRPLGRRVGGLPPSHVVLYRAELVPFALYVEV